MSPRPQAEEELTRVLALVPWIVAHPGSAKTDIARRFGITPEQLEQDLWLLLMVGVPPYSPGDYIDVDPEGDTVEISLADYFTRPLRLSPAEGLALLAAGRALLAVPGSDDDGPLATALAKLADALEGAELAVDFGDPEFLEHVRRAAEEGHRIEIEYWSAGHDHLSTRAIDPGPPFFATGQWYTDAYCHERGADRMFRIDRIRAVRDRGERFTPTSEPGPARGVYQAGPDDTRVTVRLASEASWVTETTPTEAVVERADGSMDVTLSVSGTAWLERLLLQLGPSAQVVAPAAAVDLAARAAARVRARYEADS
ncbi:MAG TPA: WYL domain-containing protein [Acidimicrobiia bacterium]|nr:WYL domain-containing protein [Acidimicrobiia bacterium]